MSRGILTLEERLDKRNTTPSSRFDVTGLGAVAMLFFERVAAPEERVDDLTAARSLSLVVVTGLSASALFCPERVATREDRVDGRNATPSLFFSAAVFGGSSECAVA